MSKRSLLPNTFQKPNWMTDELNYLLTGDEVKVLDHVTRHILGWSDKVNSRRARLSLSHVCEGFTTEDGARFYGTGLNEKTARAVLQTLCGFGLLVRSADNDPARNEGAEYHLPEQVSDEHIDALWARRDVKKDLNRRRTEAGMARIGGPVAREGGGPVAREDLPATELPPSHGRTVVPCDGRGVVPSHGGQQTHIKETSNPLSGSGLGSGFGSTSARAKNFGDWLESADGRAARQMFRDEGMADEAKERELLWRVFECGVEFRTLQDRMTMLRSQFDADATLTYWPGFWISKIQRDAGDEAERQYRREHNLPALAEAVTMPP